LDGLAVSATPGHWRCVVRLRRTLVFLSSACYKLSASSRLLLTLVNVAAFGKIPHQVVTHLE